jgi:predicted DNA-binding protein with PD1-like motif
MRFKLAYEHEGRRIFVLVFDKGDEVMEELSSFARRQQLGGSQLTGIGSFSEVTLGYFDRQRKRFEEIPINEQVELLSFIGDVAHQSGSPTVHAHVVLGRADGSTAGGHFLRGRVWPTLELVVSETPSYLAKRIDEDTGLALIDI